MLALDVNILIYAHRREDSAHEFYRNWLESLVTSREPFALSVLVAVAFVRIVTNPKLTGQPTPLTHALAVIDELQRQSNCRVLHPAERHWELLSRLSRATQAQGVAVADAQHAAIAMEYGCTWVTRDRDFEQWVPHGLRLQVLEPLD